MRDPLTKELLNHLRQPGRILSEEVAIILGFSVHDIPVLCRKGLLKPLGKPAPNGPKYFCSEEILNFAKDRDWLDRATKAVSAFWSTKNSRRRDLVPVAA